MKRLCLLIIMCVVVALFFTGPAISATVAVNFSGTISSVVENGLSLPSGNTITASGSTFTGQFSYNTDDDIWILGPPARYYRPTGPFSILIDNTYTFQSPTSILYIQAISK